MVIGLRERSDKWDAMVLSASLTGFEVEFADGIKGDEVVDKAKPPPVCDILTPLDGYCK